MWVQARSSSTFPSSPSARYGHWKFKRRSVESRVEMLDSMYMLGKGAGEVNVKRSHSTVTTGGGAASVRKASLSALLESVQASEFKKLWNVSRSTKAAQVSLTP